MARPLHNSKFLVKTLFFIRPQYDLPVLIPAFHGDLPQYHLLELPQYHLPELRGRRGPIAGFSLRYNRRGRQDKLDDQDIKHASQQEEK
jgi:hypothetical protein